MKKRYSNNLIYMLICMLFFNFISGNLIKAKSISLPPSVCNHERNEVTDSNAVEAYVCKYKNVLSNFIKKISCTNSVADLKNTENFKEGALQHIFLGEINPRGKAVGFHYEEMQGTKGKVVAGTVSTPDKYGVYKAEVEITDGSRHGYKMSSFFPKAWTAQEVVDRVNEAFVSRKLVTGNLFEGKTKDGITIQMYMDNNKIVTAFPIYEGKAEI